MSEQAGGARVLIVDDVAANRFVAKKCLDALGVQLREAGDGEEALAILRGEGADLVLLDLEMPKLDGAGVLSAMKSDAALRSVPVLIISSNEEVHSVAKCLEQGADDYLTKPFEPTILRARARACLERRRLHEQERVARDALVAERERSDALLLNVLPESVVRRLKQGEKTIADRFDEATVFFADVAEAANLPKRVSPERALALFDELFSLFDALLEKHGIEKIKTVSDVYIGAAGVPEQRTDHAQAVAQMALEMQRESAGILSSLAEPMHLRIGVSTGIVLGGLVGKSRFTYDLWGDPVRAAAFLVGCAPPGSIQVDGATHQRLIDEFMFEDRGGFYVEGQGEVHTYLLTGSVPREVRGAR